MSIVRTFCDSCGEIRVGPEFVSLETRGFRESAVCVIRCPHCNGRLEKVANDALYAMLTAVGVRVRYLGELSEDADGVGGATADSEPVDHAADALTPGEIDEFIERLAADDYLVGLIEDLSG